MMGRVTILAELLEGFNPGEGRDFRGRWTVGQHVSLQHGFLGSLPAQVTNVTQSRVSVAYQVNGKRVTSSMTHNQAAVKLEAKLSTSDRRRAQAEIETARRRSVDPNAPAAKPYKPPTEAALRQAAKHGLEFGATPAPSRGTSHETIVAALARRGLKQGARVMANGDFPAEIVSVSDRGIQVKFDDGGSSFIARGTPGFDRTKVIAKRVQESRATSIGVLLEGFAPAAAPPPADFDAPFTSGDRVRVTVKGGKSIVGRAVRPHGDPITHAIIDPEGGGAHVMAPVGDVKLDTPARHALERKRAAAAELKAQQQMPGPGKVVPAGKSKIAGRKAMPVGVPSAPAAMQEGIGVLVEAFAPPGPSLTVAQSNAQGAAAVATAQSQIRKGWTTAKHPRGRGGKFAYTTGGKRARRSRTSSTRTLNTGSTGSLVKSIQRQLGLPATGQYNPQTKQAVARYQRQHGLMVDGIVGRQTLAALRGHVNPQSVTPGPIGSKVATVTTHPATRKAAKVPAVPNRIAGGVIVGKGHP